MSLQYLDTLKQIGNSPSTKLVVPMELAGLLSKVTGLAEESFRERRRPQALSEAGCRGRDSNPHAP